jgi:hypothetical protein
MRKIVSMTAVLLILVGVMLGQALAAEKMTPLTKANWGVLKGHWEGRMDFGSGKTAVMILKVENDAPPFTGTLELTNLPQDVGGQWFPGNFANATSYGPGKFENGTITNKGQFIITGQGGNMGEFSLLGKDLDGWFYLWGTKGTMRLKKK